MNLAAGDEEEERRHMEQIGRAVAGYEAMGRWAVARRRVWWAALPAATRGRVPDMEGVLEAATARLRSNQLVLDAALRAFGLHAPAPAPDGPACEAPLSTTDYDKVKSTLRQLVRDWCAEGAAERACCYTPLIDELRLRLPLTAYACIGPRRLVAAD
jgi:carnosine N-methyltransferase